MKDCLICQENSPSQSTDHIHSHGAPRGPWVKLGVDLFKHKKQCILIVDYFSKFSIICRLHRLSTGTLINELKGIFSENGIP